MKYSVSAIAIAAAMLASCGEVEKKSEEVTLTSGVESEWLGERGQAKENFDSYVNGKWAAETEIPGDMTSWGGFATLAADTEEQVKKIVEMVAIPTGAEGERGQLERFYASFIDADGREASGVAPVMPTVEKIGLVGSKAELLMLTPELRRKGVASFFSLLSIIKSSI